MNLKRSKILKALRSDETLPDFKVFDDQINQLKNNLKEKVQIKTLDQVTSELEKFKKKLSLEPIIQTIKDLEKSLADRNDEISNELEDRNLELETLIQTKASDEKVNLIKLDIQDLQIELSGLEQVRKTDIETLKQSMPDLSDLESRVNEYFSILDAKIETINNEEPQEIKDWTEQIEELRTEFSKRMGSVGSSHFKVQINGVDISKKYADINFKGSGVTYSAVDNNTTKQVDLTLISSGGSGTPSVGGAITGGINKDVLFVNPASIIAQDSNFQWDNVNKSLNIGGVNSVLLGVEPLYPLTITGTQGTQGVAFVAIDLTNKSNSQYATSDLIISADNDDGTTLTGKYGDFGITSSAYNDPGWTINGVNNTYVEAYGGDLTLVTAIANKNIKFGVGGTLSSNEIARMTPASVLTLGLTGSVAGNINFKGKTSQVVNLTVPSVAGNWTMVLPPNTGTANFALTTDGNGITTWASVAGTGGTGITRQASIVSISSTFGAVAKTDYVAFANVGLSLTLPTAVGNTNLYTVKNVSASSVVVLTTSAQTIDGSSNAILQPQNVSIDLLSDNANWNVI